MTKGQLEKRSPSAYQRALRRLARRDQSEQEIRRALRREGFPGDEVEAAVGRLSSHRYLDEAGLSERVARHRLAQSGLGRRRILVELQARGVPRNVAAAGLAEALREVNETEALDMVARKYWRQHVKDEPSRRLPKLFAFLLRRGFPPALIRERLAQLWPRLRGPLDEAVAAWDETTDLAETSQR